MSGFMENLEQLFTGFGVAAATVALRAGPELDDVLSGRVGESRVEAPAR